ncbi:MAG: nucleotidyltransferase domain-containing protein [Candidatus Cloacimonetes bacterium]|nr:nucleotidyltransferase domain-containing protein [Candidatus Cloacimonadota bacterium]
MNKQKLFQRIKRAIYEFDKNATVILYGSRVRGDFSRDSDWDFLILLSRHIESKDKSNLRHKLYDIELETGEIVSAIFYEKEEWSSERNQFSPFYKNVMQAKEII